MSEVNLAFRDEGGLAKIIRNALGIGDYDEVRCILPQFERIDGRQVTYIPQTTKEYDALKNAPKDILIDIGMQAWDEEIWLFPAEWYDSIPDGYEIVDICGDTEKFQKGVTDDDRRCGALAFGFRLKEPGSRSGEEGKT